MTNARITRKAIENALRVMVATAPNFVTFVRYFFEYSEKLAVENTNFIVIWSDEDDTFEIFNSRSKKSTFLDFSHVMGNLG